MNANLTISPNFIEIGRLLFLGPFGIAAPTFAFPSSPYMGLNAEIGLFLDPKNCV